MIRIDDPYLDRLAEIESNRNPAARNPKSSAGGLFQFIDDTAQRYGLQGEDRFNPEKAIPAAKRLTDDNREILRAALDREPTHGELYLAHQQGAAGALRLLRNGDKPAVSVVGAEQVMNNGGNDRMTAAEFAAKWTSKFEPQDTRTVEASDAAQVQPMSSAVQIGDDLTPEEQEELAQLEAEFGSSDTPQPDQPLTPDEESELAALEAELTEQPPPEGLKADFARREAEIKASVDAYVQGQQTIGETIAQNALSNASKFTDSLGAGISAVTPDFIEQPLQRLGNAAVKAVGSLPGATGGTLAEGLPKELAEHPRLARNLKAVGQAVNLLTLGRFGGKATARAAGKTGDALVTSGTKQALNAKEKFVADLVAPVNASKAEKIDAVGRTAVKGRMQRAEIQPTKHEIEIAGHVEQISGVKKANTVQANYNAISKANDAEAERLTKYLQDNDAPIDDTTILTAFDAVKNGLEKNPFLTSDGAGKAVERAIDGALEEIGKHPQTASGMIAARRAFDKWVLNQKPSVFDANESPVTAAVREIRKAMNEMVGKAVPSADVKASLAKQSALYRALDNIAPKAAKEKATAIGRTVDKLENAIPGKTLIGKSAATAAGLVGLGGAAAISAPLTLAAIGAFAGAKAIVSPSVKTATGKAIQTLNKPIR